MRRYGGGQTDQGEVLDCCHVTSASGLLRSRNSPLVTLLHPPALEDYLRLLVEADLESNLKPNRGGSDVESDVESNGQVLSSDS